MILGAVLTSVDPPGGPIKTELILGRSETQPVKPHVHRFGLTRHDCVASDAVDVGVVSFKGRRWLRPTHLNECLV